jgi:pimeloyl-ACP methyl ester carboxylesterase
METKPFRINVSEAALTDLRDRLARTRWPDQPEGAGWSMGTDLAYMKSLVAHWQHRYDFRKHEASLNALPQFKAEVAGIELHFVHQRGASPKPALLLLHGWPDSFYRFHKVVPLLAESFDVVVPSLPGTGFSARTAMTTTATADLLVELMAGLGYEKFVAAGGDMGSMIAIAIAQRHPEAVRGIHLTDVGYPDGNTDFASLSPEEQQFAGFIQGWWMREGAFNMVQSTKPQSLAFGLNDSPVGLAAWIMSVVASGTADKLDERFTLDELLTNITLYWVTETAPSSLRNYLENARAMYATPPATPPAPPSVPAAVAHMPWDAPLPRAWAERKVNVQQFSEMPRGGHFSAWEVPDEYAQDLEKFASALTACAPLSVADGYLRHIYDLPRQRRHLDVTARAGCGAF